MTEESRLTALRDEITRMLAAALQSEQRHAVEMQRRNEEHLAESARRDQEHLAESARRDEAHLHELQRREDLHAHEMDMIRQALETRDLIGQAKGVIMATLSCSPDEAFNLLRQQSQHENRKLTEVAADIAKRASSASDGPYKRPGAP